MHATFAKLRREAQLKYLKLTGKHCLTRRQLWTDKATILKRTTKGETK